MAELEQRDGGDRAVRSEDLGYKYPGGLDLRPDSELHGRVIEFVQDRAIRSWGYMDVRREGWREMEDMLTVFIPQSKRDKAIKRQDIRDPIPVVVPLSLAVLDTLIAQLTRIFAPDIRIWRYLGRGPADSVGAKLLENVVEQQTSRFKHLLALQSMWRDALTKGIGVITPIWEVERGVRTVEEPVTFTDPRTGEVIDLGFSQSVQRRVLIREGNRLNRVDPKLYLPDPNVSCDDVQRSEFTGWVSRSNLEHVLAMEQGGTNGFFNVRYLERGGDATAPMFRDQTTEGQRLMGHEVQPETVNRAIRPVDLTYMYVNLVPAQWQLGPGEEPEKWLFCVAGTDLVVAMQRMELDHGQYPVAVCAPDTDGTSASPMGRIESTYGIQRNSDFVVNSHMEAIRRSRGNNYIYNPFLINGADFRSKRPDSLVRMRRSGFGLDVNKAIKQIDFTDNTRDYTRDLGVLGGILDQVSGATETVQGRISGGERTSAQEARGARLSAFSRIDRIASTMRVQAMYDLGFQIAWNTQQFMTDDTWVSLAGDTERDLKAELGLLNDQVLVGRGDILVDMDVIPGDNSVPGEEFADQWIQLLGIAQQNPVLAQRIDFERVFLHLARTMGVKTAGQFLKQGVQAQVMPDEQVAREVQAGNLVPGGAG